MVTKADLTKLILEAKPDAEVKGLKHSELVDLLELVSQPELIAEPDSLKDDEVMDAPDETITEDSQMPPIADKPKAKKAKGGTIENVMKNKVSVAGTVLASGDTMVITSAMMNDPRIGPKIKHGIEHSKILKWV